MLLQRVITKGRGKQCPEEINSTEQITEQYKAVEYRQESGILSQNKGPQSPVFNANVCFLHIQ